MRDMMLIIPLAILAAVGLVILLRPWPFFIPHEESQGSNGEVNNRNIAIQFGKWVERQARARGLSVRGFARAVPIECPKCHKTSNYFVYPDEVCERCWRATLKPISTPIKDDRH
ncbi:MAG: hypothetical protein WBF06_16525 [Candidatus Acidiferrales bacterium]